MKRNFTLVRLKVLLVLAIIPALSFSQNINSGSIQGNFQMDAQYYKKDSAIGAQNVPQKILMNAFCNLIYSNGNFSAGIRYESYRDPMLGFDTRYKGSGIGSRYASYKVDDFEVTVGNFYEQFGNGLILRSYEERNLGLDNAMDGIKIRVNPYKGIVLKGLIGMQRYFWDLGSGIVRGGDAEFNLNEIIKSFSENKTHITFGGSVVSTYEATQDILYDATQKYVLPENVASFAGRLNVSRGKISLMSEYAYKANNPNATNGFIYKPGEALLVSATYSQKGLGIILSAKRIDNMAFKSSRTEVGNMLNLNYLPALTRQHTYSLSSIYPYATQPNGEMGCQGEVTYTIPKNSVLGGAYGAEVKANYSLAKSLDKQQINDTTAIGQGGTLGYTSNFFKFGNEMYFQDFNIEVTKKLSKSIKALVSWVNLTYNKAVIEGHPGAPIVYSNIFIADVTYKISPKKSLRGELQHLATKQDQGNWAQALLEYSIAPKWFFTITDMYNYGNSDDSKKIHYYNFCVAFNKGANRIQLSYGKQREGILCVGGVCRLVPAADGINISITSSF